MAVRTRFAPSPTGSLHVGSVRTALFSYLYARHHQGEFFLRIEDTDHERSTPESVDAILQGMQWLGIDYDGPVIYQTDRYPRYRAVLEDLLARGLAYRCRCSKERLEACREQQLAAREKPRYDGHCRSLHLPDDGTPHVIRFKTPLEGGVSWVDAVYGEIHVANQELDDLILQRSDGHPTYNFAVVVDDLDMNITHVIRGDDHINNTPRQIHLFHALRAPLPVFAHLPMILGDDGKRLSKRHGAVNILQFKEEGYLPQALLNDVVRLGWSHGDQEIFSLEEMIAHFDLQHVSRSGACFDYTKLAWLNQHYLKHTAPELIAQALAGIFTQEPIDLSCGPDLVEVVKVQAGRCKNLVEMREKSAFLYQEAVHWATEEFQACVPVSLQAPLCSLYQSLEHLEEWAAPCLHEVLKQTSDQHHLKLGQIAQPLRFIVTGSASSPSIDQTLMLLGRTRVLKRVRDAIEILGESHD